MRITFQLLLAAGLCLTVSSRPVWAEGSTQDDGVNFNGGNHGVNRVVRSTGNLQDNAGQILTTDEDRVIGLHSISGTASIEFRLPANAEGIYTRTNPTPTNANNNPWDNKPTAYLGGRAATTVGGAAALSEFDGGLQFETGVPPNAVSGWTAFFSVDDNFLNPQIWDVVDMAPKFWRGGDRTVEPSGITTGPITSRIGFQFYNSGPQNGFVRVIIGAIAQPLPGAGAGSIDYFFLRSQADMVASVNPTTAPPGIRPRLDHPLGPWKGAVMTRIGSVGHRKHTERCEMAKA